MHIILLSLVVAVAGSVSLQPLNPRMVAIGDVHGDVDNFLSVLRQAQLVDCDGNWIGSTAVAVQMGDVCDRGPHSHSVLEYIHDSLIPQAAAAGGEFIQLMGNHELLSMRGDHRFALPALLSKAFGGIPQWEAEFSPPRSLEEARSFVHSNGSAHDISFVHPALQRARRLIMRPPRKGTYGHVISQLPVVVVRYGTVFVHAGLLPVHAQLGVKEINRRMYYDVILPHLWEGPARKAFDRMHTLGAPTEGEAALFNALKGVVGAEVPKEGPLDMGKMMTAPLQSSDAFHEINSPVWTREQVYGAMRQQKCQLVNDGLATLTRTEALLWVARDHLAAEGAHPDINPNADGWSNAPVGGTRRSRPLPIARLVVGHTIQPNGAISVFCGGRFLATDISMSQYMQGGGHLGYVEFRREEGVKVPLEELGEGYETENKDVQAVEKLLLAEGHDRRLHVVGMPTYPAIPWLTHPPHSVPVPPLWSVAGHRRAEVMRKAEDVAAMSALVKRVGATLDASNPSPSGGGVDALHHAQLGSLSAHLYLSGAVLGVAVIGILVGTGYFLLGRRGGSRARPNPQQRPSTTKVPIPSF